MTTQSGSDEGVFGSDRRRPASGGARFSVAVDEATRLAWSAVHGNEGARNAVGQLRPRAPLQAAAATPSALPDGVIPPHLSRGSCANCHKVVPPRSADATMSCAPGRVARKLRSAAGQSDAYTPWAIATASCMDRQRSPARIGSRGARLARVACWWAAGWADTQVHETATERPTTAKGLPTLHRSASGRSQPDASAAEPLTDAIA